jgi:hypothetical protein
MKNLFLLIILSISFNLHSQVDNLAKNTAIHKKLEDKYKAELKESPNSAVPHWNHANNLAKVTFNASKNAPEFYMKALEIDSNNSEIYKDFGNYFYDIGNMKNAYYCFNKVKSLNPNDISVDDKLNKILEEANKNKKYWELHQLPIRDKSIEKISDYSFKELTDYKTLFKQTNKGKYEYKKLSDKFKKNPNLLNSEESFFLLIGQTQQSNYKPYNYNDEKEMQNLTQSNEIELAIKFGVNILNTEPVNILIMRELLYCYRVKEDEVLINDIENRLRKLFSGLLYSGDGTCEKPIITLSPQEEYPLAMYLGYSPIKVIDTQFICKELMTDKMQVESAKGEIEYLHFNYTPIAIWLTSSNE